MNRNNKIESSPSIKLLNNLPNCMNLAETLELLHNKPILYFRKQATLQSPTPNYKGTSTQTQKRIISRNLAWSRMSYRIPTFRNTSFIDVTKMQLWVSQVLWRITPCIFPSVIKNDVKMTEEHYWKPGRSELHIEVEHFWFKLKKKLGIVRDEQLIWNIAEWSQSSQKCKCRVKEWIPWNFETLKAKCETSE